MKKNLLALAAVLGLLPLPGCRPNNAPVVTELSGPPSGRIDSTYLFVAHAADPDGDAVAIRFDWDNGDTSDWSAPVQSALPVRLSYVWPDGDSYEVRCQARDRHGSLSDWSSPCSIFILGNRRPEAPGFWAWLDRVYVDSFAWVMVLGADADRDPLSYRLCLGSGDTTDWQGPCLPDSFLTIWVRWSTPGTYEVRVQAMDIRGAVSAWSDDTAGVYVATSPPVPVWVFEAGDDIVTSPAVGPDGTIYIGGFTGGTLYAVGPDGALRWTYGVGDGIEASPIVGADGTVYVAAESSLYAFTPQGALAWSTPVGTVDAGTAPATAADGTIYVGTREGRLVAFTPDGTTRWSAPVPDCGEAAPAISRDGTIYISSGDNYLYAVNPDGSVQRTIPCDDGRAGPAIGADGTLYFNDSDLRAYRPDGTLLWSCAVSGLNAPCSPAIGPDGTIYTTSGDGLCAVSPNGTLKWLVAMSEGVMASPAVAADGTVYCGGMEGLLAVNPDGTIRWHLLECRVWCAGPAIAPDGTVYVGSWRWKRLYAIPGTSPLAGSAWPKAHHDLHNSGRAGGP